MCFLYNELIHRATNGSNFNACSTMLNGEGMESVSLVNYRDIPVCMQIIASNFKLFCEKS